MFMDAKSNFLPYCDFIPLPDTRACRGCYYICLDISDTYISDDIRLLQSQKRRFVCCCLVNW